MRFVYELTVTGNTLVTAPIKDVQPIVRGTITDIWVWFRNGCHNQVSVIILDKDIQFCPVMVGKPFVGNDVRLHIPMSYEIVDEPFHITFVGWSPDTKYDHVITFDLDIIPTEKDDKSALSNLLGLLLPKGR